MSYFRVSLPGSGSDYAPFRDRIGIPCVDIRYTWDSVSIMSGEIVQSSFLFNTTLHDIAFTPH